MSGFFGWQALLAGTLLVFPIADWHRVEAQTCTPHFTPGGSFGPVGATVLGTWDFDRDGKPDLLLQDGGNIRVATNQGDGVFDVAPSVFSGSVAVGDFDGDGILDLVGLQYDQSQPRVVFLKGDGRSGFREVASFRAAGRLMNPVAGDFDGDGKLDLAVLVDTWVWVYPGDGLGGFREAWAQQFYSPRRIWAADLDGDRRADLLVHSSDAKTNSLGAWAAGPLPAFTSMANGPAGGGWEGVLTVALGDVEGNGRTDVVVMTTYYFSNVGSLDTYLQRAGGTFEHTSQTFAYLSTIAIADFDGDGKADLAALTAASPAFPAFSQSSLTVLKGDGAGHFQPAGPAQALAGNSYAVLTPVEIDGRMDLILSGIPAAAPQLLVNSCSFRRIRGASPGPPFSPRQHPRN